MRRRMLMKQIPPKPSGALYWYGDECIDKTGGWKFLHSHPGSYTQYDTFMTELDDGVQLYSVAPNWSGGTVQFSYITENNIDLTPYSTLLIECMSTMGDDKSGWSWCDMVVSTANDSYANIAAGANISNMNAAQYDSSNVKILSQKNWRHTNELETATRTTLILDVSGLSGYYYFGILGRVTNKTTQTTQFFKMYLE